MFIISKAIKGKEFLYSNYFTILCKNESQAQKLAEHLNSHNESCTEKFRLKENEIWFVYEIDKYDNKPNFKLSVTKDKILIKYNY